MMGKHPPKYPCPFCDKRYTSRSGLLSHKNTIHLQRKPYRCESCNEHFFTSASRVAHIHKWHSGENLIDTPHPPVKILPDAPQKAIPKFTIATVGAATKSAFFCTKCGEVFAKDSELDHHLSQEHPEEEEDEEEYEDRKISLKENKSPEIYECGECFKSFDSSDDLLNHFDVDHDYDRSADQLFTPAKELKKQLSKMLEEFTNKPPPIIKGSDSAETLKGDFKCNHCNTSYEREGSLDIHYKYHHRGIQRPTEYCGLYCKICKRVFSNAETLSQHQSLYCQMEFPCSICGEEFQKISLLVDHVKVCHKGASSENDTSNFPENDDDAAEKKQIVCEQCGMAFYDSRIFDFHLKQHEKSKSERCKKCDFVASTLREMTFHVQTEHLFKCSVCYKMFANKPMLHSHFRSTHSSKVLCPICPGVFKFQANLVPHLRERHANDVAPKPIACEHCDFESSSISKFITHYQTH